MAEHHADDPLPGKECSQESCCSERSQREFHIFILVVAAQNPVRNAAGAFCLLRIISRAVSHSAFGPGSPWERFVAAPRPRHVVFKREGAKAETGQAGFSSSSNFNLEQNVVCSIQLICSHRIKRAQT
jgi:hypothetical protein